MAKRSKHPKKATITETRLAIMMAPLMRAGLILIIAATASYVSQLTMGPVYGDIPSSLYHNKISMGIFLATWVLKRPLRQVLPPQFSKYLPIIALHTPLLVRYLARFSAQLGPVYGPIVTEGVTFYPVLVLSVLAVASITEFDHAIFDTVPASISWAVFQVTRDVIPGLAQNHIGTSWILTRCGLWNMVGALYALVSPSLLLFTVIPAMYTSGYTNTMCVLTPALNDTLARYNHSIIARQESITGYVSILDNFEQGYRVMRCGHSLLGGEWQHAPKGLDTAGRIYKEPIYAIFVTMEAVRLITPPPENPKPKALAIGLGIGTSIDALIRHGIEVDIVELDPVVYKYAKDYFGLSPNHTSYLEDAVGFVRRESSKNIEQKKYDYILHDVFTGGAVPAKLFTLEIFRGLKTLLADDGVIAINWAGDLKLQAARSIIETVRLVFHNCRTFREEMLTEEDLKKDYDVTNMVIFCTNSRRPYTFRRAVSQDYLGSYARRQFLYPKFEINLDEYWAKTGRDGGKQQLEFEILQDSNIFKLDTWQQISAVGHWSVIRTVVPDKVWENY
ncbi:S-adenosyl-L-methionine-dependent methyltransferase [Geopyxis carbonaria]|nr:S-adenosyl-L-methionine-dependent methyltransferase [Geopyxis carbonaria]